MTRPILFVCLFASFSIALSAFAREQRPQSDCEEIATQAEANRCAHRRYLAADADLNKRYNQLMAALETEQERAMLKAAEVAWINYRNANCDYESYFYMGGTIRPLIKSSCLARMTEARSVELKQQLKDLEQ